VNNDFRYRQEDIAFRYVGKDIINQIVKRAWVFLKRLPYLLKALLVVNRVGSDDARQIINILTMGGKDKAHFKIGNSFEGDPIGLEALVVSIPELVALYFYNGLGVMCLMI